MIEGAGVQLFSPDRAFTLLVQGKSGKWGWTKGHRELTDNNWLETALREVHEESGFLLGEDYFLCSSQPRQWGKRLYWQGITFKQEPLPRHNTNEHLAIGWVSLKSIQNISLGYDVHHWMLFSNKIHCDF
jgi:8-oxo-dGTP pyrophosphatase MutT (NUDIX family)